jgi:hypothetical protein
MTAERAVLRAELFSAARQARANVLRLWPEETDPSTLPTEQQAAIARALDAVTAADMRLVEAGFVWPG